MILLLVLLVLAAFWSVMTSLLLRAAIALALTSAVLAIIMFQLDAPYAAVFELSVCAGLIPVIFISVISLTHRLPIKEYLKRRESRILRFWPLPIILLAVTLVIWLLRGPLGLDLPWPGALKDVRYVLWNYKKLDLFGQIVVLLAGAYGVLILFRERK